jgi:acetyltransferase-like isoleucine patch superfamily enzyme
MRIETPVVLYHRLRALFLPGRLTIGGRARIMAGARILFHRGQISIGRRARLHTGSMLDAQKGSITLGERVSLNPYAIIYGLGGVTIGNDVRIAAHAVIVSFEHNYDDRSKSITDQGHTKRPVVVEDDVWIGSGAKILAGSHVSKGCVIAANAVIKGRTEPYGIYGGIPARLIKYRGE